jgi:UDP-glucuronate 4-epimerase
LFTRAILAGEPVRVFNHGDLERDFTYIDDIVDGVLRAIDHVPKATPPHAIYNLGNSKPERLPDFIAALEAALGKQAIRAPEAMQLGDVKTTYADISSAQRDLGYSPKTPISENSSPGIAAITASDHRIFAATLSHSARKS